MMHLLRGLLGIAALIAFAWLLSSDRRRFPWRVVLTGLALQWILALAVLKTEVGRSIFDVIGSGVTVVLNGADQGARFVFGELAGDHDSVAWKAIVGIKIMSTIIVVASLSAVGYYYGILQRVVSLLAMLMKRSMGLSGAESLAGAANVFLGQTEAPLLVRPYIRNMTRSELMALMTGGFATVAAGVMAVYVGVLAGGDPQAAIERARHILTASLMSAPAAFVMAKVMIPESEVPETLEAATIVYDHEEISVIGAVTRGAEQGMKLAINVMAMLIAFIALIAILDTILIAVGRLPPLTPLLAWLNLEQLDLNGILGLLFSPVAWLLGAEASECRMLGGLLGKAMATNEIIAYGQLAEWVRAGALSPRTEIMATYSLCGFANILSIGIQIGGIGAMVPERRGDLVRLGPRAMLGGAFACWMTGCIAGILS